MQARLKTVENAAGCGVARSHDREDEFSPLRFKFKPRGTFSPKYFTNTNLGGGFSSEQNPDSTKYTVVTAADDKQQALNETKRRSLVKGPPLSLMNRSIDRRPEVDASINSSPADVYHNFVRSPRLKAAVLKSGHAKD